MAFVFVAADFWTKNREDSRIVQRYRERIKKRFKKNGKKLGNLKNHQTHVV